LCPCYTNMRDDRDWLLAVLIALVVTALALGVVSRCLERLGHSA